MDPFPSLKFHDSVESGRQLERDGTGKQVRLPCQWHGGVDSTRWWPGAGTGTASQGVDELWGEGGRRSGGQVERERHSLGAHVPHVVGVPTHAVI